MPRRSTWNPIRANAMDFVLEPRGLGGASARASDKVTRGRRPETGQRQGTTDMTVHKIGIIGLGKIAQDQHLPVIAQYRPSCSSRCRASAAQGRRRSDLPRRAPEDATPDLDAVAICTPPHVRHAFAREALAAGKHVMLEKPPAATLAEMPTSTASPPNAAASCSTTWHSHYNAAVDEARELPAHSRQAPRVELEGGRPPLASGPGLDLDGGRFRRLRSGHQRAVDPHRDHAPTRSS